MAAAGRVLTGFCAPYVALYANSGGTTTYSSGQVLARGVSVSVEPETADENIFWADNGKAETAPGSFTAATLTLTVDGLFDTAEKLIYGLPTAEQITVGSSTVNAMKYGKQQAIPYCGVAFVAMYQSEGVVTYVPYILTKCQFKNHKLSANTQEDTIEWQTQELEATVLRDDTTNTNWKWIVEPQASLSAAEAVIKAVFNITTPATAG